jgi:glycosyltransferase involved in cell wall biosynthesis
MTVAPIGADAIVISCWLLALGWARQGVLALVGMRTLPDLTRIDPAELPELRVSEGPHVSVIVPACNEEEAIEGSLRSLLASTGLRLEIVAVDDRSTDRTGERMDAVAAEAGGAAHELVVIHNRDLPEGWLGKPHALELGVQQARAPWLLFTDADVTFTPRALELALRHAMAQRADHLVLMPTLVREGIAEGAMEATIQALALWDTHLWKVQDARSPDFVGVGGFALIRREVLNGFGGMQPLRMEVVEDLSLGYMLKRGGFRSCVALGPGVVNLRWIRGLFGIVGNIEKNGFAVFRYRVWLAALTCLGLAIQAVVPLAAMFLGRWGLVAGLSAYAAIGLVFYANRRANGVSPLTAALFAPCVAALFWAFIRSTTLTLVRDGVTWRGTHYPLKELRRNAVMWKRK